MKAGAKKTTIDGSTTIDVFRYLEEASIGESVRATRDRRVFAVDRAERGTIYESIVEARVDIGSNVDISRSSIRRRARIGEEASIADSIIEEGVIVPANATVRDIHLQRSVDILVVGPIGTRNAYLTAIRSGNKPLHFATGCFSGPVAEFFDCLERDFDDNSQEFEKWSKEWKKRWAYVEIVPFLVEWVRLEPMACAGGLDDITARIARLRDKYPKPSDTTTKNG